MKKLTFKVSSPKDCSVVSLIKDVNKISCRIYIDIENGFVAVENVDDTMIDSIIELVDNYYTVIGIDIDNTFEETSMVQKESVEETTDETTNEVRNEAVAVTTEQKPTVLGPQSEDDLIIQKVEFENEYVQNRINSFLKTAYWALYNRRATEKDIGGYILTCQNEMSMRYSSKPIIEFSIGDIVDVNYGFHLPGEIMGGHVHAIVCNILNEDMAYVVPITKERVNITSKSYLLMEAPKDATYCSEFYKGGTVLLDKGKYVRVERFNSVIGKVKTDFFEEMLHKLASTFDFKECITKISNIGDDLTFTNGETTDKVVENSTAMEDITDEADKTSDVTEDAAAEVVTTSKTTEDATNKAEKIKTNTKKVGSEESALLETIGFAFDKLDASKNVEEQVESFLNDIGMSTTVKMVTQSFIIACNIKKINYENVILELHKQFPEVEEEIIKNILKEAFKNWLEKYPILAEKCPKISLMSVLRVFAKKFS